MDIKEVKIAHLKAIMKNEGLSGNKFAKKLKTKTGEPLKPSNLSNYLTGKKEVFETLASQIMDAFPDSHYRRAYILGLDEYMTDADYAKASWNNSLNTLKECQRESVIMENALFGLAELSGFQIVQNTPCPQDGNIEHFIHNLHAGITISRDGKQVNLSLTDLNALENKLCDWLEFELLHMMK